MKQTWQNLGASLWYLGAEAYTVMALRTFRIASGAVDGAAETTLMVSEKIDAAGALQSKAVRGALGTSPLSVATASVQHYRRRVRANLRRLAS